MSSVTRPSSCNRPSAWSGGTQPGLSFCSTGCVSVTTGGLSGTAISGNDCGSTKFSPSADVKQIRYWLDSSSVCRTVNACGSPGGVSPCVTVVPLALSSWSQPSFTSRLVWTVTSTCVPRSASILRSRCVSFALAVYGRKV